MNGTVGGLLLGMDGRVYNERTGRAKLKGGGYIRLRMRCNLRFRVNGILDHGAKKSIAVTY